MVIALVHETHNSQLDKGGKPYVLHPLTVALTLVSQGYDNNTIITGLFHDVVEDNHYSIEDLHQMRYSQEVLDALMLLTHDKSTDDMEYVEKAKTNPIAKAVKMADLLHNSDIEVITEKDEQRFAKYESAMILLKRNDAQ